MTSKPALTFFCELEEPLLGELLDRGEVIPALQALPAAVSLGIIDLSEARANAVRRLNQAGIPVTAWLLLPKQDGYWFNLENITAAERRWIDFSAWSDRHQLKWAAVGLDIEPDLNTLRQFSSQPWRTAFSLVKRLLGRQTWQARRERYMRLAGQIRAAGWRLESYQFPVILEERQGRSNLLLRLLGLVDLPVDNEVLMLYSSFFPKFGAALLASYLPQAGAVGIGVTGGGIIVEGTVSDLPLTWEAFERDLRLTAAANRPAYIFSLEGCVWRGWLPRLLAFDWQQPAPPLPPGIRKVNWARRGAAAALFLLSRPLLILLGLAAAWLLVRSLKRN